MTTIAQQAQELAQMARSLHRQPISKKTVDAAVASTKPAAVMNTRPEIMPPHKEGCDCASCVKHSRDAHPENCDCADCMAKHKDAAEPLGITHPVLHPQEGQGFTNPKTGRSVDTPKPEEETEEEEFIEEEIHPGIHEEVKKKEGKDLADGVGEVVARVKGAAQAGAHAGESVAAGKVPGINDGQHPADSAEAQ
jgi:hypothetical protein